MILVAGLAVAGLVGIAAAFYFSLRTGSNGYRRGSRRPARPAGSGSSRADRQQGSAGAPADDWEANDLPAADDPWTVNNPRTADNNGSGNAGRPRNARRPGNARRLATHAAANYGDEARTGPDTIMDFGQEPGLLSEPTLLSSPTPLDAFGPPVAKPARRAADLSDPEEDLDAEAGPQKAAKSRRRMGWRKGSDIDEEMWPAEAFGGLSDDQFWDDLASDKPLTTTARSAHQDAGTRRDFDQAKDQLTDAAARPADGPARPAARGNGRRPAHGAAHTPGHPGTRPRPTVPPVPQASPIPSASQPNQLQPTHLQATTQLQPIRSQPATQLLATQPTIPAKQQAATQPVASARPFPAGSSQPMRTTTGPNETRGRRQGGAGDDPLTSTAFSLRASGPVDGWSNQAPSGARETGWDQYNAAVSQGTETQAFGAVDTPADNGGYPLPPYRPSGPPPGAGHAQAQRPSWPREGSADPYAPAPSAYPGRPASEQRPYGEGQPYARRAPYGNAPADEPRRPNGAGARTQPPRPGYQGPGEDRRRPRDPQNPQNPRDGYRR